MLSRLPEDIIGHRVAGYLHAPELLKLLGADKALRRIGTSSVHFWTRLLDDSDDEGEGEGGGGGDVGGNGEHGGHYPDGGQTRRSLASPCSRRRGSAIFDGDVDDGGDEGGRMIRGMKRQKSALPSEDADAADAGVARAGGPPTQAGLDSDDDGEVGKGGGCGDVNVDGNHGDHSRDGRSSSLLHSRRGGATASGGEVDIDDGGGKAKGTSMIRPKERQPDEESAVAAAKMQYLIRACTSSNPLSVRLHSVGKWRSGTGKLRDGHVMCVLGNRNRGRRVVLTGGTLYDDSVQVMHIPRAPLEGGSGQPQKDTRGRWFRCSYLAVDEPATAPLVCGATLTALDSHQAVHFGGLGDTFGDPSNDVHVLTVQEREVGNDGGGKTEPVASWRKVKAGGDFPTPRGHHTATLINQRYLLILGGRTALRSMLEPALLDCLTWTWLPCPITTGADNDEGSPEPEGGYGHSVVLDGRRDRLVMFGGRGGEVYGLEMGGGRLWREDLVRSLPSWRWTRVRVGDEGDDGYQGGLGGHLSFKVAPDMVLLMFSRSGYPAGTVVTYDLRADQFRRVTVEGPHTCPVLFKPAGAHLDTEGWIVAHGGLDSFDDVAVLDLAPALLRRRAGLFAPPRTPSRLL